MFEARTRREPLKHALLTWGEGVESLPVHASIAVPVGQTGLSAARHGVEPG